MKFILYEIHIIDHSGQILGQSIFSLFKIDKFKNFSHF